MLDMLRDLEQSLIANPKNRELLASFADWMIEHHDPRGEYLRLQLAVESGHVDQVFADRFWHEHRADMLGPLKAYDEMLLPLEFHYCWPTAIEICTLNRELLEAATKCPLLTSLVIRPDNPAEVGDAGVERLLSLPIMMSLRSLELVNSGITDDGALIMSRILPVFQVSTVRLPQNHLTMIGRLALETAGFTDIGPQSHDFMGMVPYV